MHAKTRGSALFVWVCGETTLKQETGKQDQQVTYVNKIPRIARIVLQTQRSKTVFGPLCPLAIISTGKKK